MSEVTGGRRAAGTRRGLPPLAVLVLGLLAAALCMLLLFGPFSTQYASPGRSVQFWLRVLLDGRGPYVLHDLLWNRFVPSVGVILVVILAVLPWFSVRRLRAAADEGEGRAPLTRSGGSRRAGGASLTVGGGRTGGGARAGGGTRRSRPVSAEEIVYSDDGRILVRGQQDTGHLRISVRELRRMVRSAGMPWHTDYETAGGARGALEILRAVHTGPVGVRRAEEADGTDGTRGDTFDAPAHTPDTPDDATGGHRLSTPEWTPSYSGSVYTSTSLYSSERSSGGESAGDEGAVDAAGAGAGTDAADVDSTETDEGRSR